MKTADLKFLEMCEEIDIWKKEAKYWKDKFDILSERREKDLEEKTFFEEKEKLECGILLDELLKEFNNLYESFIGIPNKYSRSENIIFIQGVKKMFKAVEHILTHKKK